MTRQTFYAQQPRSENHHDPIWTRGAILRITALFVAEEQRFPTARLLRRRWYMPSVDTVYRLWGSMSAYRVDYQRAYPGSLAPQAREEVPRRGGHAAAPQRTAEVPCLRCGAVWRSPDKVHCRICATCHAREDRADGLWLAGEPVRLLASGDLDDLMEWDDDTPAEEAWYAL